MMPQPRSVGFFSCLFIMAFLLSLPHANHHLKTSQNRRPTHPGPFLDRPQPVTMGPCVATVLQVHLGAAADPCGVAVFGGKGIGGTD